MSDLTQHPQVEADHYVVYPSCFEQMGNSDRDMWCLTVMNGHAWGWSVRRGRGMSGGAAMNRKGEWIYETRGSGRNKPRRWSLQEALALALEHVDRHEINGSNAAEVAARWPVRPTPPAATDESASAGTRGEG